MDVARGTQMANRQALYCNILPLRPTHTHTWDPSSHEGQEKREKKKKNAWIIQTASTFIATKFRSRSSWTKIIKDCSKSTACSKTPQQHPWEKLQKCHVREHIRHHHKSTQNLWTRTQIQKKKKKKKKWVSKKLAQPKTEQASFLCFLTSQKKEEKKNREKVLLPPPSLFSFSTTASLLTNLILLHHHTKDSILRKQEKTQQQNPPPPEPNQKNQNRTEKKKCRAKKIYDNNNFMIIGNNNRDFGSFRERFWQRERSSGRRRWCKGRPHSSYSSLTLV